MENLKYFEHLIESKRDYKKIVLSLFIFQNHEDLLREIGLNECDINRLNLQFKNVLKEHHEEYLDYVKNEEESVIERK